MDYFLLIGLKDHFFFLLNYQEEKKLTLERGYKEINNSKIDQFPKEVQKAITPVYVACDYTSDFEQGGFNSITEAWEWIKENSICSDCRKIANVNGFWRKVEPNDLTYLIKDGNIFERINHVSDTMCGEEWYIETQSQLDELKNHKNIYNNPIHENKDGWYFWNELWADEYGPYDTQQDCIKEFKRYCEEMGL